MSKAKGQKIVVKFDKALLGEVVGNHTAFTVTGMQKNPIHTGTPELTEYTVDSVERYPIATLYEDDFIGAMDGVEVGGNGVVLDEATNVVANGNFADGTTGWQSSSGSLSVTDNALRAEIPDIGAAIVFQQTTIPIIEGTKYFFRVRARRTATGDMDIRLRGSTSGTQSVTLNNSSFTAGEWQIVYGAGVITSNLTGALRLVLFIATSSNETVELDGNFGVTAIDMTAHGLEDLTAEEINTLFPTYFGGDGHFGEATYTTSTPADTLPTDPRLKWTEDLPTGTSITAEYAVNQDALSTPVAWTPVNNNDLLTIPDPATGYFLWLKFTLATTDTAVTPTLLSVWLEEAEAPPDTIILNFDTYNRFNDVEGAITVAYNQSLGTLAGDSAVASFSVPFTPTGLLKTPIDEHTISVGITDVAVNLLPVTYIDGHTDHTISASVTGVTVNLIHVNDINP